MNKEIKKGSLIELFNASENNIKINLLRKSFSGEIIKGLSLNDSLFARCDFSDASIYGSTFTNTDFIKCDFSNVDLYHICFTNCRFNECKFDNAKCDHIQFNEETTINQCSFKGINLADQNTIIGIDVKDLNVISEDNEPIKQLINIGYTYNPDENTYDLKSSNEFVFLTVVYDEEAEIYRNMIFVDNQSVLTTDLYNLLDYSEIELFRIISNAINFVIRKYDKNDPNDATIINSLFEIENIMKEKAKL